MTLGGRALLPGLLVALAGAAATLGIAALVPVLPTLPLAVLLGLGVGNVVGLPAAAGPGLRLAGATLLRVAIVLLGLRLSLGALADLGAGVLVLVVSVVVGAFALVAGLARLAGLPRGLGLLTATGFAICGASAIAAAQSAIDVEDEDVAASLGLVMLFGTASIAVLPAVAAGLGLDPVVAGTWVGVSVHDVGQVVAAAGALGPDALAAAVPVKLARVLLIAPVLAVLAAAVGRRAGGTARSGPVPLFVVGFLVAVGVRSLGVLPEPVLAAAGRVEQAAFAAALFALGTAVQLARLRALGPRPLAVAAVAYTAIASVALVGAALAT